MEAWNGRSSRSETERSRDAKQYQLFIGRCGLFSCRSSCKDGVETETRESAARTSKVSSTMNGRTRFGNCDCASMRRVGFLPNMNGSSVLELEYRQYDTTEQYQARAFRPLALPSLGHEQNLCMPMRNTKQTAVFTLTNNLIVFSL